MSPLATATITIRTAYSDDEVDLTRLAALDSAEKLPPRPVLLAEVDGQLRAAPASPRSPAGSSARLGSPGERS